MQRCLKNVKILLQRDGKLSWLYGCYLTRRFVVSFFSDYCDYSLCFYSSFVCCYYDKYCLITRSIGARHIGHGSPLLCKVYAQDKQQQICPVCPWTIVAFFGRFIQTIHFSESSRLSYFVSSGSSINSTIKTNLLTFSHHK